LEPSEGLLYKKTVLISLSTAIEIK